MGSFYWNLDLNNETKNIKFNSEALQNIFLSYTIIIIIIIIIYIYIYILETWT
jgi:hypothetical protein